MRARSGWPRGGRGRDAWVVGCAVLSGLCLCGTVAADAAAQAPARDAAAARESVRAEVYRFLASDGIPGVVVSWAHADGEPITVAAGAARRSPESPMTSETRVLAGSVGKTFVAATVVSLADEGLLDLDDPLSRWLGEEAWFERVPNAEAITLRMLLSHTSGVPNHIRDPAFAEALARVVGGDPETVLSPIQLVEFVLDDPPLFPPGEGWGYSDTNYVLLALAAERAAGRDLWTLVRARLLEPLGLEDTGPALSRTIHGLATGYSPGRVLGVPEMLVEDGALALNPATEWAGGGLFSTAPDLVRWITALATGRTSVGPEGFHLMRTGAPGAAEGRYGLGLSLGEGRFGPVIGHDGLFPGYLTKVAWYPEADLALAVVANSDRADLGALAARLLPILAGESRPAWATEGAGPAGGGEANDPSPGVPCPEPSAGDFSGRWSVPFTVPNGSRWEGTLALERAGGDAYRGTWTRGGIVWAVEGRIGEDRFELTTTGRPGGEDAGEMTDVETLIFEGRVVDGTLEGELVPVAPGRRRIPRGMTWTARPAGC